MTQYNPASQLEELVERYDTPRPAFELHDMTSKAGDFTIIDSNGNLTSVEGRDTNDFTDSKEPRIRIASCLSDHEAVARFVLKHEFAHFLSYREHRTTDKDIARQRPHGRSFRRHARRLDGSILNPPERLERKKGRLLRERRREKASYRLFCGRSDCSFETFRQRKSKPIKNPDHYGCPDCGGRTLVVEAIE